MNLRLLSLIGFMAVSNVYAEPVCISITANVNDVDDMDNILSGSINIGDVVSGTYIYDSMTPDTNLLSTVGDYQHTSAEYGVSLNVNGLNFKTDPSDVDFLVEIVNDHGNPASDNYLFRSYNNIFDVSSVSDMGMETMNHISWQLDDSTLTANLSDMLPISPPILSDWNQVFGLNISSESMTASGFRVRSTVSSVELCAPDTVTVGSYISATSLNDINGNSFPEMAVLRTKDGLSHVIIKDSVTGDWINKISYFGKNNYSPINIFSLSDINGNGVDEIGVLAVDNLTNKTIISIKDASTGAWIGTRHYPK